MQNQYKNIITITILIASLFSSEFQLKSTQRGHKTLTFIQQELELDSKDG